MQWEIYHDISRYSAKDRDLLMGNSWVWVLFERCLGCRMVIYGGYDGEITGIL